MRKFAVLFKGKWHIANLVMYTEYEPSFHWMDKPPCWSEDGTTALICEWHEAEDVIPLPKDAL